MDRNELIGAVAARYLTEQLETEGEGSIVRFCLLGLESSIVTAIAKSVLEHPVLGDQFEVHVPPSLALPGVLPDSVLSTETAAHWRHSPTKDVSRRGILFAVTDKEAQQIGTTLGDLPQLDTDHLRALRNHWLEAVGIRKDSYPASYIKHLKAALSGLEESNLAVSIERYADYILAVSSAISEGRTAEAALDMALPALRLPMYSGSFSAIPERKRGHKSQWRGAFNKIDREVRPYLFKLLPNLEPIESVEIEKSLEKFIQDNPQILSDSQIDTIRRFIHTSLRTDRWLDIQDELCAMSWQDIAPIFKGLTLKQQNLWSETIDWFEANEPNTLDPNDERYLEYYKEQGKKKPDDEDREFFNTYSGVFDSDRRLYKKWERFIYSQPKEYDDFIVGLYLTVYRVLQLSGTNAQPGRQSIIVRIPKADAEAAWRGVNRDVAIAFAQRYNGIERFFGSRVNIDFGNLNAFFLGDDSDEYGSTSQSKDAHHIRFEVELNVDGATASFKQIFYWKVPRDGVVKALRGDLVRLLKRSDSDIDIPFARIARQTIGSKGQIQRFTLADVGTFHDVDNENGGRLVPARGSGVSITRKFLDRLNDFRMRGILGHDAANAIENAFREFIDAYKTALEDWTNPEGRGIASPEFISQANAFGALLETLRQYADDNTFRTSLWRDALQIGVIQVGEDGLTSVISPWQPLRLVELHIKAYQVAVEIEKLLDRDLRDYEKAELHFETKASEFGGVYYPDVCIGFDERGPKLLAVTETINDYSLAEYLFHDVEALADVALDENPEHAARRLADICSSYLDLLPHERANFSVLIYNAEAKALPRAVANALSKRVEEDDGLRCDLLLTHTDKARERKIYREQNLAAADDDAALIFASEAAKNFMSRLRIGFMEESTRGNGNVSKPVDIVFLQDVVASNAKLRWFESPYTDYACLEQHIPTSWSLRRPHSAREERSGVWLVAPRQPACGGAYLNALYGAVDDGLLDVGKNYLPCRVIDFHDNDVRRLFEDTHSKGDWVVSYDGLTDRRLLKRNGINIIRHIHDQGSRRNLVISSTADPMLLRTLVTRRLHELNLSLTHEEIDHVARMFIDRATDISGHIVMRAARYGKYANELLGVVLSQQIVHEELGMPIAQVGWYFLDDYAALFGQKEERIADLLVIAPCVENEKPVVNLVITEAKFVESNGFSTHARKSAQQLRDTVNRITRAFDPALDRVDRTLWLNHLANMMLEEMSPFTDNAPNGWSLVEWAQKVRLGEVEIRVAGYSHVFTHDSAQSVEDRVIPDEKASNCLQQIFSANTVRRLVEAFVCDQNLNVQVLGDHASRFKDIALRAHPTATDSDHSIGQKSKASIELDDSHEGDLNTDVPDESQLVSVNNEDIESENDRSREGGNVNDDGGGEESWLPGPVFRWACDHRKSEADDEETNEWLRVVQDKLRTALTQYGMRAVVKGVRSTPNSALIRLQGSDDLDVSKLEKYRTRLLTAHSLDLLAIQPLPGEIVVHVARPQREILSLADMWFQRKVNIQDGMNLSLLLGAREDNGEPLYLNIGDSFGGQPAHGPHTLIAGETGGGKSVLVQNLLLDICLTNHPRRARIILIDPKQGVDYPWIEGMPHLEGNIIVEQSEAIAKLEELVIEMDERYSKMRTVNANNLKLYNKKVAPEERMPVLWLFHDELAEWMMVDEYRSQVASLVSRLGTKARGAGIHLVFIAQRPDNKVFPMQLRNQLGNRLALRVSEEGTSEIVINEKGAERLLGHGHLAAKLTNERSVIYAQVPYLSMEQIDEVAAIIKEYWERSNELT